MRVYSFDLVIKAFVASLMSRQTKISPTEYFTVGVGNVGVSTSVTAV